MPDNDPQATNQLSPTALSITVAAKVLSKAGGRRITEEMLRNDIDDGAPTNTDGTLNVVHYAAWLIKHVSEMARGD